MARIQHVIAGRGLTPEESRKAFQDAKRIYGLAQMSDSSEFHQMQAAETAAHAASHTMLDLFGSDAESEDSKDSEIPTPRDVEQLESVLTKHGSHHVPGREAQVARDIKNVAMLPDDLVAGAGEEELRRTLDHLQLSRMSHEGDRYDPERPAIGKKSRRWHLKKKAKKSN